MSVTLSDFEIRYTNLKRDYPQLKKCSVSKCKNPVDVTMLGIDTSCSYHRLLFDFWNCEVMDWEKLRGFLKSQKGRRRAFTNWRNKTGKEECDKIVLQLAQEPINWKC